MKRIASYIIVFTLLFSMVGNDKIYADYTKKEISDGELQSICREKSSEEIDLEEYEELIGDGLTRSEAEFYIKFDKIVKEIEKRGLAVNLEGYENSISDEEFSSNIGWYREKILEGDREAIAKGLTTVTNVINEDLYRQISEAFYSGDYYETVFEDGSRISFVEKNVSKIREAEVDSVGDGYNEAVMEEGIVYPYDREHYKEGQWRFQSGISYSKVYLYVEYDIDEDSGVTEITYSRGGQSSYGVVSIANSTGASIVRQCSNKSIPAEARNEVIFTVSSSFGATFLILSMSLNAGMSWTQYIIFKIYPVTEEFDGAKYSWQAAEYK